MCIDFKIINNTVKKELEKIWKQSVKECWSKHNPNITWNYDNSYTAVIKTSVSTGEVIAYAIFTPYDINDTTYIWISHLYVRPEDRGHNLGSELIEKIRWRYRGVPIRLGCYNDNINAERFYRRLGFVPVLTEFVKE